MRTLAVLLFIVAVGVGAVQLARTSTVADGHVIEADLLGQFRARGVVGMECDREIPIGRDGARFSCVATLDDGRTQTADYAMDRAGNLKWKITAETDATEAPRKRIPPSGDPWAN